MKSIPLIVALLLSTSAAATERQALKEIQEELTYLGAKIEEAKRKSYQGEATGGVRVFSFELFHNQVLRWQQQIDRYLNTPKRQPMNLNAYHDSFGG